MHEKLEKIITLLTKEFNKNFDDFHGMYLFGAHKDGKMHKNDDIELVAVFDKENKAKREIIWPIVGKIETDFDVYIDLTPTTEDDLKKDDYLYEEAVKNGIFLK